MSDAQGTWIQKADFTIERSGAVAFSINGKGYLGTGADSINLEKDLWEYDPILDTWTQKADMGSIDGREWAVGFAIGNYGYIGTGKGFGGTKDDFWQYDPVSNTWTQKADFPGGPRYYAVGFSIGNKGYLGTGTNNFNSFRKDFYEYDPATDTWTQRANLKGDGRINAVGFSINNEGYIANGGVEGGFGAINDLWQYDPSTDQWKQKASYAGAGWFDGVGFSIGDKGYVGTGLDIHNLPTKDFWEYDPTTDAWTQKMDVRDSVRIFAVGFAIGNNGYVGTGKTKLIGGNSLSDFWQFTPDCTPPTTLTATNITNSKATLSWNAVSGAVKYKVRYRVSGNNPWTNIGSTTTTRKINELIAGTTYQWQVRTVCSIDPSVSSDWSAKESFTTALRLSDDEETDNMEVYPNPATTSIQLHLPSNHSTTLTLFNLLGEKVKEQTITGSDITIDVSELPAGMYVVRVGEWSGKFVKE